MERYKFLAFGIGLLMGLGIVLVSVGTGSPVIGLGVGLLFVTLILSQALFIGLAERDRNERETRR